MSKHTPGPWRWEINQTSKSMHLVGGVPRFDLTVMDFVRWGLGGAAIRLRENEEHMNIMHRVTDRPDWIAPFPCRKHHAHWCADLVHPDAQVIAAAPTMLSLLERINADADQTYDGSSNNGQAKISAELYQELCEFVARFNP